MERNLKLPGKKFENFGIPREVFVFFFFWKFWTILFHALLEVAKNSNQTFCLNGKRPGRFLPLCHYLVITCS